MSENLEKEIANLEKKIKKNEHERKDRIQILKEQLTSPVVLPAILIGSIGLSVFLLRKKRFRNAFAYLTTLSLATSNIYKNIKFAMNIVERIQDQRKKPDNQD